MAIQKLLIRYLLEPLSGLAGKIGEKGRPGLFYASGIGIFIYFFLNHMRVIQWRYLYSFAICSVLLAVMILATLPKKIEPVKFNPWFTVCWFGAGGLMLLSGLINNTDYLSEALLLVVAYPVIYICWNNWDTASIFRMLLNLCKISLVIFFVATFLLAQITSHRFGGIFSNVNNCASYLALAGACLLVEIFYEHGSVGRSIVNVLLFGMCYGMIDLTNSRTGKLALLFTAVVGVILYFVIHKFRVKKSVVACLVGCVLVSAAMPVCLLGAFQARQYLALPYYDRDSHSLYYVENQSQTSDEDPEKPGKDQEKPDQDKENPDNDKDKPGVVEDIDMDSFVQFGDNKNSTEGKNLDQYSTGRISIWKEYLKRLELFGVDEKEPVYLKGKKTAYNTAHMTVLEIAYESGIFAGILYLMMNLLSGILAIVYAWRNRSEKYALMPLAVILTFGVVSFLSSVHSSYNYALTLYYYLVLFPVITKGTKSLANK